jgi:hypothetical protein
MGLQMAATLEVPGTERKSDREPTAVLGQLTKQRYFALFALCDKRNAKAMVDRLVRPEFSRAAGQGFSSIKNWVTTTNSLG